MYLKLNETQKAVNALSTILVRWPVSNLVTNAGTRKWCTSRRNFMPAPRAQGGASAALSRYTPFHFLTQPQMCWRAVSWTRCFGVLTKSILPRSSIDKIVAGPTKLPSHQAISCIDAAITGGYPCKGNLRSDSHGARTGVGGTTLLSGTQGSSCVPLALHCKYLQITRAYSFSGIWHILIRLERKDSPRSKSVLSSCDNAATENPGFSC